MQLLSGIQEILEAVGHWVEETCDAFGHFGNYLIQSITIFMRHGVNFNRLIYHANVIGVDSIGVVALTGVAVGAILAKHSFDGLHKFGPSTQDMFIGPLVYLSMLREFGSMISGIMLTARAGSAMAAELGSMKITEQVDALETLSINPIQYLVIPRVLGSTLVMPLLSLVCVIFGVGAGYFIAVHALGVNSEVYIDEMQKMVCFSDLYKGLIKAAVFGFLISQICCYKGLTTTGGAQGVGVSTTNAVVYSAVVLFFVDFLLTQILFQQ